MASVVSIQNSLAAGELSPALSGRTDLEKWHSGTSTCRNFFVNYRGGVSSRAGLAYVGTCKQQYPVPPRDIPFQFSINQGYVLEFGELYMRIKFNGAYVVESAVTVTTVSALAVFNTSGAHGYSVGDWIYDVGNTGFTGQTWIVKTVPTSTSFTVTDLYGNTVTSAVPTSGGTVSRVYTVVSPYHAVDLPYLKYSQSADVMTLTCVNTITSTEYIPYNLARLGNTDWTFTALNLGTTISPPTGVKAVANSTNTATTWYSYVVTAISASTGEESVASAIGSVQNNDIALYAGSNSVTWNAVAGASAYNIYLAPPSFQVGVPTSNLFGFVGTALGPSFTDNNTTPDYTTVPPVHKNPFARGSITDVPITGNGSNYSDGTIGYTVTTSTGSGFSGRPVTGQGKLLGFIIDNAGSGYLAGDTIAFTDSGGGIATGTIGGASNVTNGQTVVMNGVTLTFVTGSTAPTYHQIEGGNTSNLSLIALANYCNSSTEASLQCATYSVSGTTLTVTYNSVGAVGNSYTLGVGTSSWSVSGAHLTGGGTVGSGGTGTLTVGAQSGTYPGVSAYYQQRRVYASSIDSPDAYWFSRPGLFDNFDSSIPSIASDAVSGTPWAQQVNGVQFMVSMPGGLVVLTGRGAWQVNGGQPGTAFSPETQTATPQAYNGCNALVPPIPINYDILYVQAKGSIVRDLSYNFFVNIYTGTDLTVLSNHLFFNKQILQWAYAEEPYKLVWLVMSDGSMLSLTYLKEQEVYAWTRHDTQGIFVSVTSITEPPVDAVYVITQRYIQGAWRYYSEKFDHRVWNNAEEAFCVDAGLSTDVNDNPNATLTASAVSGTGVTFTASAAVFSAGNVGQIIRMGGGSAKVTSFTNAGQVVGNIINPITIVIPDETNPMPAPATAGNWSILPLSTIFTGLNQLEGQTVAILADGSVVPNQVVTNGMITLQEPASLVTVGLPYICQVQTLYVDHPENGNTTQNRRKNIAAVGLRVEQTRGLSVGVNQPDASYQENYATLPWTNMIEVKDRTQEDPAGSYIPLYTGDYYKAVTGSWNYKGQVAIQQTYPLPANILSVISYWNSGDDR